MLFPELQETREVTVPFMPGPTESYELARPGHGWSGKKRNKKPVFPFSSLRGGEI